jgi:N4-(beta-N-acetylglucosaminyl)-L-asparaginase
MPAARRTSTRRQFLARAAAAPVAAAAGLRAPELLVRRPGPIAISSGNGLEAVKLAVAKMTEGVRPVDAAVAGVNLVEDDPKDDSVGLGGLPNADGVVELDACVMDGPTHLAGAVASLRNIKNPSKVALVVMRRTDHVLLVGPGALEFARAHGFVEENLLTERSRREWLRWKERLSKDDDWVEPSENELEAPAPRKENDREPRSPGTIHVSALDAQGRLGACTTTSGLAFKVPGRVGDSPLIGCGLYLDSDVGSAGSTGRGEACILANGASSVVGEMRRGATPTDACLEVLRRVVRFTRIARLRDAQGRPSFNLSLYALNTKGERGAASLYPASFSVATSDGAEKLQTAALYER